MIKLSWFLCNQSNQGSVMKPLELIKGINHNQEAIKFALNKIMV